MPRICLPLFVALICFGKAWPTTAADTPAPKPPAVLVIGSMAAPRPIEEHLRAKGWQTLFTSWGQPIDRRLLKQFNVVVLAEYPIVTKDAPYNSNLHVKPELEESLRKLLWEFVEDGGGLLTFGGDFPMYDRTVANAFLKYRDIQVLFEQVVDPTHTYVQKNGMQWVYRYTSNIRPHPATQGVRTIFYPTRSVYGEIANPLKLGADWHTLVLGSEQAASHPIYMDQENERTDMKRPGTYPAAPPLAAVRDKGHGRVAVFGWGAIQTFYDYGHFMVEDVHFTAGGDGQPSDGLLLLQQTLTWLAEPSQKPGPAASGGYQNQPTRQRAELPQPIVWTPKLAQGQDPAEYWKNTIGAMDAKGRWYRGLIGARTKLTGGSGTVAQYAAAARAAGLDFLGFTEQVEDLSAISKDAWDTFRKECRDATGPDLLVLPGQLVYRGKAGDCYFRVSDFPSPPARGFLTADGRRIDNALYEHFDSGLNTLGPMDIRHEPTPHWASRNYNSLAVTTTRDGQTTLDLDPFLYVTQNHDDPKPVAIDLITSPDQAAAAARRFVNLRFARSQDELRRMLKTPDNCLPVQISNGPRITNWQGRNQWPSTFGRAVPGTQRIMFRLQAESGRPLSEVIIYDGARPFRRYKLDGHTCDLFLHALHDRQHEFVAVVKDTAGGMAVASQMSTADQFNRRLMCSDRQNSLTSSVQLDPAGYAVSCPAGIMQEKYSFRGITTVSHANTVDYVPWLWDGSPGPSLSMRFEPLMWEPPYAPPTKDGYAHLIARMEFPLGSRDVLCQAAGYEYISPDKNPHYGGFWPMQPLKGYQAYARVIEFTKTPDRPTASLVEGYYVMQQDGAWDKHEWYWSQFSHIFTTMSGRPTGETAWFMVNPAKGEFLAGAAAQPDRSANLSKTIEPGGYMAYARGTDMTALFPLDTPMLVAQELNRNNWHRTYIGFDRLGQSYRKGDLVPFRYVAYTGSPASTPDNRALEQFRTDYGLGGTAAYTVQTRQGKVRSTRYVLELDAADGGFGGVIGKARLDTRLPVRVHGVNPNWTCGVVDRRERWWLPIGVMDDLRRSTDERTTCHSAYIALDVLRERDVWLGNLLLCDQPALKLTLLPDGEDRFSVELHNPTDQDLATTVRTAAEFNLLPPWSKQLTVPAGTSVVVPADAKTLSANGRHQ